MYRSTVQPQSLRVQQKHLWLNFIPWSVLFYIMMHSTFSVLFLGFLLHAYLLVFLSPSSKYLLPKLAWISAYIFSLV
jgi:hypothetical protein